MLALAARSGNERDTREVWQMWLKTLDETRKPRAY